MRIVGTASPPCSLFALALAAAVAAGTSACGGSGLEQPQPLTQRFDDMHIAAVSMEEKQPVFEANNEWSIAKAERAKVQTELDEAQHELDVLRNEFEKAKIDEESAQRTREAAEKTGDQDRINTAASAQRDALMKKRAIDKHISYLEAQVEFLKVKLLWAEQNMYAKEAAYYQAMGRIAQQNNIKPPGVDFNALAAQAQNRSESAQRLKALSDREKKTALDARGEWEDAKRAAEEAAGG